MLIHALHLGPIRTEHYHGKPVRTAGHKQPVPAARVTALGLAGDEQAERRYHGGPDQALCAYGWEHYADWQTRLGGRLGAGAFSENLTLAGLDEAVVCLGDRYRIEGTDVVVQVTSPRQPCERLAAKLGQPGIIALIKENGRSGCYLRVEGAGELRVGQALALCSRPAVAVTLAAANQVLYRQRRDRESLLRVLSVDGLGAAFRSRLERRLHDGKDAD